MEPLPTHLLSAYRRTIYVVSDPAAPMVLRIGQTNHAAAKLLQSHGLASALFISAYNPWGVRLSDDQNSQRHIDMKQALQSWQQHDGFGASLSGNWLPETSVLVLCDDPELQLQWLQLFEQNAAVRVLDNGDSELVINHQRRLKPPQLPSSERASAVAFTEFPPGHRLCFYPSSGHALLWAVMDLNCDLFVFSDKDRRYSSWGKICNDFAKHSRPLELVRLGEDFVQFQSGNKTGVLLWEDNNLVVKRLERAQLRVHHFVGICDGCCEGGNYECVHDRPFVRRLMRVAADGMRYSTDHSRPLQGFEPDSGWGMFHTRKFLDRLALDEFPEPVRRRQGRNGPEADDEYNPKAVFELQGVLIRLDANDAPHRLEVLPKGHTQATDLKRLKPFRSLGRRGILAEYMVSVESDQVSLEW